MNGITRCIFAKGGASTSKCSLEPRVNVFDDTAYDDMNEECLDDFQLVKAKPGTEGGGKARGSNGKKAGAKKGSNGTSKNRKELVPSSLKGTTN